MDHRRCQSRGRAPVESRCPRCRGHRATTTSGRSSGVRRGAPRSHTSMAPRGRRSPALPVRDASSSTSTPHPTATCGGWACASPAAATWCLPNSCPSLPSASGFTPRTLTIRYGAGPASLGRRLGPAQAPAVPRLPPGGLPTSRCSPKATSMRATASTCRRCGSRCGSSTQRLDRLEEMDGQPWIADHRKVVLPPRHELHTSMESLIHHFKIVTEGFRVPEGEVYTAIESPRGELGCYVCSEGGPKPWRVKFRAPSLVALQATATWMTRRADRRHDRDRRVARRRDGRGRPVTDTARGDPGGAGAVPPRVALGRPARPATRPGRARLAARPMRSERSPMRSTRRPPTSTSIASFYDQFHLRPVGAHLIEVCTNVSCAVVGAHRCSRPSRRRWAAGRARRAPTARRRCRADRVSGRLRVGNGRLRRPRLPAARHRRRRPAMVEELTGGD